MTSAVARAHDWPRVLLRAAKLAEQLEERDLALKYLTIVFSRNPAWAKEEIGSGDYAELGANPVFHTWLSPEKEQQAILAYHGLLSRKGATSEDPLLIARTLLEAGHAPEARSVLATTTTTTIPFRMARAEADAALGDYSAALNECREAQSLDPNDWRISLRISRLQERVDFSQDLK